MLWKGSGDGKAIIALSLNMAGHLDVEVYQVPELLDPLFDITAADLFQSCSSKFFHAERSHGGSNDNRGLHVFK